MGILSMIGAGTGPILGLFGRGAADRRQLSQQAKLQELQIKGQKEMMDYGMGKQLEMWKNTSYTAQKEQMEKAGINPALMYGMSGGGGQTTGNASGSVSGGNAPSGGHEIEAGLGMMLQAQMIKAQTANLEADTEKKKVEAAKTAGVDTTKTKTEIQSLTQGIENQKAVAALTKADTYLKEMEGMFQYSTFDDRAQYLDRLTRLSIEQVKQAEIETFVKQSTKNDQIKIIAKEAIRKTLENGLIKLEQEKTKASTDEIRKNIELKSAEIEKIANDISLGWINAGIAQTNAETQQTQAETGRWKAEMDANYPGLWQVIGGNIEKFRKMIHEGLGDARDNPRWYKVDK